MFSCRMMTSAGDGELGRGKVPDRLDAERDDAARDALGSVLGDADDRDPHVEAPHDPLQRLHRQDGEIAEDRARPGRVVVEDRHQPQAVFGQPGILAEGRAEPAGADEDCGVLVVDPEKLLDGLLQSEDRIACFRLALVADQGDILADLRVVDAEELGEVPGGDIGFAARLHLGEDLVIERNPPQRLLGDGVLG